MKSAKFYAVRDMAIESGIKFKSAKALANYFGCCMTLASVVYASL